MCPVASEETVCCNLRTIDAVENCGMGCSYCAVQTFYGDEVVFDAKLKEKLEAIELEDDRFYHIGTGQSSDALMWGNQHGLIDDLCDFARAHPNVLLEFKSKSKNVAYFLKHPTPPNIVLSWSLNTPTVIRNEEHFSASLEQRLRAARQVADRGIKLAFHFHPMVHYDCWQEDYAALAAAVTEQFDPSEVLFISLGSVTFIKPVIKALRQRATPTKMLQMEMVPGAKGKLSYPHELKVEMFGHMYEAFAPWQDDVFFYLCMEQASLWHSTFGFAYETNEAFEIEFGRRVRMKWD
jgi:spore photoproduct lyase